MEHQNLNRLLWESLDFMLSRGKFFVKFQVGTKVSYCCLAQWGMVFVKHHVALADFCALYH